MSDPKPKKKGCGSCLGKGCLVLLIIGALLAGLSVWGYVFMTNKARPYMATSGEAVPVDTVTQDEYDALVKRMETFKSSAPGSGTTLTLSAHDINVLVAMSPEWSSVKGKVHVAINDGKVDLNGSVPLTSIPNLRDRFLNGTLAFTPTMDDRVLHITMNDLKLRGGEKLPAGASGKASDSLDPQAVNRLLGDPVVGAVLIKAGSMKADGDKFVLTRSAD